MTAFRHWQNASEHCVTSVDRDALTEQLIQPCACGTYQLTVEPPQERTWLEELPRDMVVSEAQLREDDDFRAAHEARVREAMGPGKLFAEDAGRFFWQRTERIVDSGYSVSLVGEQQPSGTQPEQVA